MISNAILFSVAAAITVAGCASEPREPVGTTAQCPPVKPTLLLDHGPRAQTTPWVNRQRQDRYEAALRACREVRG
jgi:hypothetical protein